MHIDKTYHNLINDILSNGTTKDDRTGTGTISVFGRQLRANLSEGFPILTSKYVNFDNIVSELLWFLRGQTDLRPLVVEHNHIWVGDAYKKYLDFCNNTDHQYVSPYMKIDDNGIVVPYSKKEFINQIIASQEFNTHFGNLGNIYGYQWRNGKGVDQISEVINTLRKNPDSRRIMVNAWAHDELDNMILPPCHYGFQLYTAPLTHRERCDIANGADSDDRKIGYDKYLDELGIPTRKLSLMWNQRSVDTPLGLPYNIASYALLLEIFAKMTNMIPDELIGNLGDTHIYLNQVDAIKVQLKNTKKYKLPTLEIDDDVNFAGTIDEMLATCTTSSFSIDKTYKSYEPIKFKLSN